MQNTTLRQLYKYQPDTAECRKETYGYNKLHIEQKSTLLYWHEKENNILWYICITHDTYEEIFAI